MKNNRVNLKADKLPLVASSRQANHASATSSCCHQRNVPKQFSPETIKQLKHYVYRLVDPRNGRTFYVGKGTGNRVFQHAIAALKPQEEGIEDDLKTELIREIHREGLPVIPIIHRHGLKENTALEVEAALIDAYPGLANVQSGHGSYMRGCRHAAQVQALYAAPKADFKNIKALIIKIRQTTVDEKGSVYEAARSAWRVDPEHAKGLPVVACVGGIIKEVYTDVNWRPSAENPEKYEFVAKIADKREFNGLLGHRLPEKFCQKGMAHPFLYT